VTWQEFEELSELTEELLARAKINKGGRPASPNPRKLISLRLPADVIGTQEPPGIKVRLRQSRNSRNLL
jgi:uncharacterized protein (DUF4415 family)